MTAGFSLTLSVLLAEYGGDAERMAADAGTSVRTAEKWAAGLTTPRSDRLLDMMRRNDRLAERVWVQLREAQAENADARRRMAARRGGAAAGRGAGLGGGADTPDRPVGGVGGAATGAVTRPLGGAR